MANTVRNFIAGRMNKTLDERLIPNGEYIDALNIRLGSTEASEIGSVENSKGNTRLTTLGYNGFDLSLDATCIGAYADGEQETMYWFIHDDNFTAVGGTNKLDLIVSYNTSTDTLTYHVISLNDGDGVNTTLNFSRLNLITGINLIDDLLFFTDDLNQPRRINVTKNYADPVANIDAFLANDILVVKAPPIASPTIEPFNLPGEENFLEDRLICFAYRYKYEDNEYSAVSQFSAPSFVPEQYSLNHDSFLNEGMVNFYNACRVTFDSGGPLVIGIDLLFKEMTSNSINVIEKVNKADEGYADNTDYTITFSNSKIFTVLPSSEILRLYDNVPLLAKAQTVMGNRLMYGNYVDGWDLNTAAGNPTQFDYQTTLLSDEIGFVELSSARSSGDYTFGGTPSIVNSVLDVDFTAVADSLVSGATIDMTLSFTHSTFTGNAASNPLEESTDRELNFLYTLNQSFASVDELFNSADFQDKVGIASNILPVYSSDPTADTSCDGLTLTDLFNCTIPDTLSQGNPTPVYKYASGIDAVDEPVSVMHTAGTNVISFQFPAMQFVNDVASVTTSVYEYYAVTAVSLTYSALGSPQSLHSNRGYEVGMVYMDGFNRSTTALVSTNNTVSVGCGNSSDKNQIQVTIPTTQIAPAFATRYKFVIKPDEASYETIYTSIFFYDTASATDYFLLRGENAAKVEEGDRLIIKRDVSGALSSCEYATVLEKKAQEEAFITVYQTDGTTEITVPQGVYMQIRGSNFNSSLSDDSVIAPPASKVWSTANNYLSDYPIAAIYGLSGVEVGGQFPIYDIPIDSRIRVEFEFERLGARDGESNCERRTSLLETTYSSSQNYENIIDWWNGDNIGDTLNDGERFAGDNEPLPDNQYIDTTAIEEGDDYTYGITPALFVNYYRWYMNPDNNEIRFIASGTKACGGNKKRRSSVSIRIELFRAESTIVFETEPQDALADVWYESSESYPISSTGLHTGNVQTQTAAEPAIVDTAFFNCFAFGNGVESYKIRDSIAGRALALGNRVTTVSAQDFKRADRFADMTYSGVFNNESNLNKLNEFNLGLFNYKQLEESFGPIEKMVAQDSNILVLQEDKISYVLASKNLISDSTGGGVVASVPEILGTQIARIEEFGISNNPESFAQWGASKYFSDAKRGAVIQLMGNAPNAPLSVVSEAGMRSWFRDMFITNFSSQKLGGFDPYMNEYVLANNMNALPDTVGCIACGITQTYAIPASGLNVCYNLGETVGITTISWPTPFVTGTFSFTTTYNGSTASHGPFTTSGSVTVDKTTVSEEQLDIAFTVSGGTATVNLTVGCPAADELTIVLVTLTNDSDSGQLIHNQYRWVDGTFSSPTHSNQVPFISSDDATVVSQYDMIVGPQGGGVIPADGATVTLVSDKQATDNFVFDGATDDFMWLRSATLYENTPTDIALLLAAVTTLSETGSAPTYSAEFDLTAGADGDYIYLVWNYSASTPVDLCYSTTDAADACCVCTCSASVCTEYTISNTSSSQVVMSYDECTTSAKTNFTLGAGKTTVRCSESNIRTVSGSAEGIVITRTACDCGV